MFVPLKKYPRSPDNDLRLHTTKGSKRVQSIVRSSLNPPPPHTYQAPSEIINICTSDPGRHQQHQKPQRFPTLEWKFQSSIHQSRRIWHKPTIHDQLIEQAIYIFKVTSKQWGGVRYKWLAKTNIKGSLSQKNTHPLWESFQPRHHYLLLEGWQMACYLCTMVTRVGKGGRREQSSIRNQHEKNYFESTRSRYRRTSAVANNVHRHCSNEQP